MIRIGITGQAGFIGTHLFNTLGLSPDKYERIGFEDNYFQDVSKLNDFVSKCDVIVHLAAMNRHNDPDVLYQTNIDLVTQLITACETTGVTPHILFSSSIQEERDNLYGRSKKKGRELFENWATKHNCNFTALVIPNVFGPFGNPYYNSVVATFCHQLTHHEEPKIDIDGEVKLIYVGELVKKIIENIEIVRSKVNSTVIETIELPHSTKIYVSRLLEKLKNIKKNYFEKGIIPDLDDTFDRDLFATFLCYIDHKSFFPYYLKLNTDNRGSFVEVIKLNSGGQVSFSTTVPGITRGNHFHSRKAERFAVIQGKARIDIRRIGCNEKISFELDGDKPAFVDMPIWFTHNITNIGDEELLTIFWINEHFDPNDPDTYYEEV
jgi:UDP-2-acetamido-2,6-beta-L-arabino-hexul-4-ose reductase